MDIRNDGSLICPKCRRPIEDDEEYICYASATLAWRCAEYERWKLGMPGHL